MTTKDTSKTSNSTRLKTGDKPQTRYEYRAWFNAVPKALDQLQRSWSLTSVERRVDVYLLHGSDRNFSLKLRGGETLELKHRTEVPGPLQRWSKDLSSDFPLEPDSLKALIRALPSTQALRLSWIGSPAHLIAFGVERAMFVPCTIQKHRLIFTSEDAQVDFTRTRRPDSTGFTIGIESPDPDQAFEQADRLGLTDLPNQSYSDIMVKTCLPHEEAA